MRNVILRNCFYDRADREGAIDYSATESRTKQSFKDECDVNNIMAKYKKTGILPQVIKKNPEYGDFSNPVDFLESMDTVAKAQQQFEGLPAQMRERFENDPYKFLEFCSKKENREEMASLGLLNENAMEALKNEKQAEFNKKVDLEIEKRAKTAEVKKSEPKKD